MTAQELYELYQFEIENLRQLAHDLSPGGDQAFEEQLTVVRRAFDAVIKEQHRTYQEERQ